MNRVRTVTLLLVLALLVGAVFTGCGQQATPTTAPTAAPTTDTTPTTAPTEDPFAEKLELVWVMPADYSAYKEGSFVETEIETRFNVDLKVMPINTWEEDKLSVTIAGGLLPDVFARWAHQKYFEDGIIREIPEEMVREYWPTGAANMDKEGDRAWTMGKSYRTGGLIWVFGLNKIGDAPWITLLRKDWMDKVGITKVPETLDEFYLLAKAFREQDPDGNNVKDTYVYGGGRDHWAWNYFWAQTNGAFGWVPNQWIEEDGKIVNSYVSNRYKEMLKTYRQWFSEDLIDPEAFTDQYAIMNAKIVDGKLGATFNMASDYTASWDTSVLTTEKNPEATWAVMAKLTGPTGLSGTWSYGQLSWAFGFGAETSDEKMIRAMQIIEAMESDFDLWKIVRFGEEGVDYTVNEDGVAVAKEGVVAVDRGIGLFVPMSLDTDAKQIMYRGKTVVDQANALMQQVNILKNIINSEFAEFTAQNDPTADFAAWFTLPAEFYVNAVTKPGFDIDAEWDAYVASWKAAAGKVVDDVQSYPTFRGN